MRVADPVAKALVEATQRGQTGAYAHLVLPTNGLQTKRSPNWSQGSPLFSVLSLKDFFEKKVF